MQPKPFARGQQPLLQALKRVLKRATRERRRSRARASKLARSQPITPIVQANRHPKRKLRVQGPIHLRVHFYRSTREWYFSVYLLSGSTFVSNISTVDGAVHDLRQRLPGDDAAHLTSTTTTPHQLFALTEKLLIMLL